MRRFSRQVVECVIILVLLEEKIKRPAWRSLFPHEQGGSRILHVIPAKRKNIFAGESRPTRARGLKPLKNRIWLCSSPSRPTRARGLKPALPYCPMNRLASRPTRARGLKLLCKGLKSIALLSRPTRARGLKHILAGKRLIIMASRPTRARGLKPNLQVSDLPFRGRAPRGRVD